MRKWIIGIGILVNLIFYATMTYAVDVNNFKDISVVNSKVSYGIDDRGMLLKSINGKWETVSISSEVKQSEWEFCGVDFANDSVGWIIGNNKENKGVVLKTFDGGKTWVAKFPKVRGKEVSLHCISFADARIGYIGASNGNVLKTTDGGINWIETTKPVPNTHEYSSNCVTSIWVDKSKPLSDIIWLTTGNDGWVARTIDGGFTWLRKRFPDTEQDFTRLMKQMKKNPDWIKPMVMKNSKRQ
ncbi:MAG: YCF48-related protein [bacterium]|nr:YCF48-related protein [bacterium]